MNKIIVFALVIIVGLDLFLTGFLCGMLYTKVF